VRTYSLRHLSDHVLLRRLTRLVKHDRHITAAILAHIAEVEARKLYLAAAYPSMYSYCVGELRLSEDAAYKRIRAARAARRFPQIFEALAEGRMHLSGLVLLVPFLTEGTHADLLKAAEHKTKSEIERLVADRFPRPDLPTRIDALELAPGPVMNALELAPGPVDAGLVSNSTATPGLHSSLMTMPFADKTQLAPGPVMSGLVSASVVNPPARVAPLSPQKYGLQVTIRAETHEYLREAQDLLGHQVAPGDVAEVLHRALRLYVTALKRQKFAETSSPRPARESKTPRHIPAHVKRSVWERDGAQCTFTNDTGQRCPATSHLEFDHADPVGRGGEATVESIRLRCRAHNQYIAERVFGEEFMNRKREAARKAAITRERSAQTLTRCAGPRARAGT
jgi:hypothetical protein